MFETFVGQNKADDEEIVGLVAYALYKRSKAEWVRKIRADHDRGPTQDELVTYYGTWSSTQVEAMRAVALSALAQFGESFVADARPGIIKDALRGKFLPDVGKAMFASFCYTLILIAAVLALRWSGVDLLSFLEKASPAKAEIQGVGPPSISEKQMTSPQRQN